MVNCQKSLNGKAADVLWVEWDAVRGFADLDENSRGTAQRIAGDMSPDQVTNPTEALEFTRKNAPKNTVLFFHGAHAYLEAPTVAQGVWNLRDHFKTPEQASTLVLLGPSLRLPPAISRDVLIHSEELPTAEELGTLVDQTLENAAIPPEKVNKARTVETLRGLSLFEAETVLAVSIVPGGVDSKRLWDRKVRAIEATDGLTVYRGAEAYKDIGGLDNGKAITGSTIKSKRLGITCLVFFDEMDKGFAASGSDTSGTTQDQNKALLSYMQDENIRGMLWLGPPGTGKTMLAKSSGNEYGLPVIFVDLAAMKGSLVGQSEQNIRAALKVIHSISDGRALFIGACNRTETLPPELRRRFNYSSLFFDLPDNRERETIWKVKRAKYEITAEQGKSPVDDDGWTGAEIENCCLKSWAMECSLADAAKTIVPVSKSAADVVRGLRQSASNKYVSASNPGLYVYQEKPTAAAAPGARKIQV